MAMMADCVGFQAQIASIIELLANSAVLEICKLVDDGYAALRSQMELEREQSEKENEDLRRRLQDMDVRVRSYERKLRRRYQRDEMHDVHYRPPEAPSAASATVVASDDHPSGPVPQAEEETNTLHTPQEEAPLPQVKQERADCDLNLKVEVNIRSETGSTAAQDSSEETDSSERLNVSQCCPTEAMVDLTCRSKPKGQPKSSNPSTGPDPKLETQPDCAVQLPQPPIESEPSPERLNSLGLDLAWMQERVSHLGAAFAQAGLNNSDIGHPSCSYPTQVDMEVPPTMLFPGNAHEMAAFPNFDIPTNSLANQRRPCKTSSVKEPMVCNFCGRVFPSMASLEVHQRSHTGERPYSCQHCGKGFAQPNNLRVHLLIHSGERRYHCSLCGKSFISSSHLKRHRTVHTQEKPYSCARCGQSFSQLCSVRRHRLQSQCGL